MRAVSIQMVSLLALCALGITPSLSQNVAGQGIAGEGGWSEAAPLAHARNELFGAVVDDKFYTFGGFDGETYETNIVEVYNPSTDEWAELGPMLEGANHAGIAVLDDTI